MEITYKGIDGVFYTKRQANILGFAILLLCSVSMYVGFLLWRRNEIYEGRNKK